LLKRRNIRTLLIAGISTDHAVSTTVRSAYDLAIDGR
jgi:nicotinamidase-related amidase